MKIKVFLITLLVSVSTIISCDVLNNVLNFTNCHYDIGGLGSPSIAGVSLNNIQNINNLNAISVLKIGTAIASGNLPLTLTLNVNATNPNNSPAELEGLEWAMDLENKTLFTGNLSNRISIPANGGKTVIPLNFNVDLMQFFKGESTDNILNFVQSVLNVGESSSKVSFKIRPSIMVGGQKISAPNFITLSKSVGK